MNAEALLITRLVLHLATIYMLARYHGPTASFKGMPSVCAGLIMGSSAAMAVQIFSQWNRLVLSDPQPQLVVFVFAVFLPIFVARGNMAMVVDWVKLMVKREWRFW